MKVTAAFSQIEQFANSINTGLASMSFAYEILNTSKKPFKEWFRDEVPCKGYSKQSGIYIFSDSESNVLYIGKAASNNFGSEIYGKFGAVTKIDIPYFGKSSMAKWAKDGYADYLFHGDVIISAVSIKPKEFSSLIEVFLHVWCKINEGELPPLNKQIG